MAGKLLSELGLNEEDVYIPDSEEVSKALKRITHLAIGAHQDDIELMAADGIAACFHQEQSWFGGITLTDGAGSCRGGIYTPYSEAKMCSIRRKEQEMAAMVGEYSAHIFMNCKSQEIKAPGQDDIVAKLMKIISYVKPEVIYCHSFLDRHLTHAAASVRVMEAVRRLPEAARPHRFYGCEVWGSLEWLPENYRVALSVDKHTNIIAALNQLYDSQLSFGKDFYQAAIGRRIANAVFDMNGDSKQLAYAMDLSKLIDGDSSFVDSLKGIYRMAFMRDTDNLQKIL